MSSEAATPESEVDSESDSSTVVYDHEPFETFKARVLKLCQTKLALLNVEISVERMHGGGFNRIIGVSVASSENPTVRQYICRIPRFEAAQLDRDVAPLRLLQSHPRLKRKTPVVIAFDPTTHNVLESPYMIQTRIPGISLSTTYPELPHEIRCAIANELGVVFSDLHSIKSPFAGRLTLSTSSTSQGSWIIQPFKKTTVILSEREIGERKSLDVLGAERTQQTTLDVLHAILRDKKDSAVKAGRNHSFRVSFFDSFIAMASEMGALGVLDGNYNCLCHLDLEPRNILFSPLSRHPQTITGILDWDSALFAPSFMSCSPPMWLWAWNDEDEEEERFANNIPPTPELRELKKLFEDAAGPTYRRFAYSAQYRLARRLFRLAIDGLQSNEDITGAEMLLFEWGVVQERLKAQLTLATPQIDPLPSEQGELGWAGA